ncbi:hypothetical protein [Aquibium microcysteis]|uniref:hypothetical protein n=1 Tax=Aquibium microcysteis TaxID=675281 RepID=UPI00165D024A|nr:hypothetical protein [Aquibium microcysteis]
MVDGRAIIGCGDAAAECPAAGRHTRRRPLRLPARRVVLAGACAAALVSACPSGPASALQGQGWIGVRFGVGTVSPSLGEGNAMAAAIARTADGKLVVVGNHDAGGAQHIVVLRYEPDGTPDRAFGADGDADGTPDGVVDVSLGDGDDVATAVAVQPDGKILVAGHHVERASSDMFLLRLDAAGLPDAGFGAAGNGVLSVSLGEGDDVLRGVAVAADGTIVVAGDSLRGDDADIVVARFASDGTPDAGFGADGDADGMPDGFVAIDLGAGDDRADALALAPDGSILVAGSHVADDGAGIVVARLTASGALDAGFGTARDGNSAGVVAVPAGDGDKTASAIAIAPDGKIVVAGTTVAGDGSSSLVVARLNADGTPDIGFGAGEGADGTADGFVTTPLGGVDDLATALALGADGTVFVGGYRQDGDRTGMAVVRYTAAGAPAAVLDVSLGAGGDEANGMVFDGDGRLVLAGSTAAAGGRSHITLVRLALD